MISEEKLEEIIKNKGVIWVYSTYSKPYRIMPITFDGKREIDPHAFCLNWNVKNIFETKEDAEFYAEFSCIERTERLELPTWEEFIEMEEFCFFQKNHKQTIIRVLETKYLVVETSFERYYTGDLNKENYTLACRKAKELFLGE